MIGHNLNQTSWRRKKGEVGGWGGEEKGGRTEGQLWPERQESLPDTTNNKSTKKREREPICLRSPVNDSCGALPYFVWCAFLRVININGASFELPSTVTTMTGHFINRDRLHMSPHRPPVEITRGVAPSTELTPLTSPPLPRQTQYFL